MSTSRQTPTLEYVRIANTDQDMIDFECFASTQGGHIEVLPNDTYEAVLGAAAVYATVAEDLNERRKKRGETDGFENPIDWAAKAVVAQAKKGHIVRVKVPDLKQQEEIAL